MAEDYVVIESGKTTLKDLYTREDWMAIWLGFLILVAGLLIFLPRPPEKMAENLAKYNATLKEEAAKAPFKTIAWHKASADKKKIRARDQGFARTMASFFAAPAGWKDNPVKALYRGKEEADAMNAAGAEAFEKAKAAEAAAIAQAQASEQAAAAAGFQDPALNGQAEKDIAAWLAAGEKASKAKAKTSNKPFNRIPYLFGLAAILGVFFGIGNRIMGKPFLGFFVVFFCVFFIAVLSYIA